MPGMLTVRNGPLVVRWRKVLPCRVDEVLDGPAQACAPGGP